MPGERGFTGFTVASFLPGTLGFDVVSSFSLADPSAKAAFFLSLTTATATVTLTPTHKLPAGPAKALKQASEVASLFALGVNPLEYRGAAARHPSRA